MFSERRAKLLEESTNAGSYGSISNAGLPAGSKTEVKLTSSSPPVLEPSKDPSHPSKPKKQDAFYDSASPPLDPWRTLATQSCPEPSTRVPITSDDQTHDHSVGQQIIDEQKTDGHCSICSALVNVYKNTAISLRNSIFIYIFQALFFCIQFSAIVMAILYDGKCYASELLPAYGALVGIVGSAFTGVWITLSCFIRLGRSSSDMLNLIFVVFFVFYLLSIIIEMAIFGVMSFSFDPNTPDYCDQTFYYYTFYKHIATGVTFVVAMILYIPGSLNYLCCNCLSEPTEVC